MKSNIIFSNMAWRFAERTGAQLVQFIVSIVLARILMPEDYGVIAIVNIFISLLEIFIDNGLGNSLIQKKESDEIDFSTVFYANIFLCIILYFLIWLLAPVISEFFYERSLTDVLRVTGLLIIISGIKNIQQAYVAKKLLFKKFFAATLSGTIIGGIVGLFMAIYGYGVWALVAQKLINYTVDTIVLWFTVKWRPVKYFSFKRLKELYSFGWKLLVSSLINQLMSDFRQVIVGKVYSSTDLALYNRGNQLPSVLMVNITSSIDSVLFPVLSKKQDNIEDIKALVSRSIMLSEYILMPILIGLITCSNHLVGALLSHKWDGCIPYIIILSASYIFSPINLSCTNALKAIGKSDMYLQFKTTQNIFSLISIIFLIRIGPIAIAISLLLTNIFGQIYSLIISYSYINYTICDLLRDIYKTIIISLMMGTIVFCVGVFIRKDIFSLLIQVFLGVAIYIILSCFFKCESMYYIKNLITKRD